MHIPNHSSYKGSGFIRPKDDISPKLKQEDPQYALDYCRFIFSQYMNENTAIKISDLELIRENRAYAEGRQSGAKYKEKFLGGKVGPTVYKDDIDREGNETGTASSMDNIIQGLTNINYDEIFSPLPKYVSNIVGLMTSQEHDVTVEAEDEVSGTLKEEMKFDGIVREEHKKLLEIYNKTFNLPSLESNQQKPKSLEEIELFENIGEFKLPYEIGMEKALSHTEYISRDSDIKEEAIRDLITIGKSPMMTYINPETGKVKYKWLDVENLILEGSSETDYANVTFGGYVEYITVVSLRAQTGYSEEKLLQIIEDNGSSTKFGTDQKNNGSYEYDDYKVAVLVAYWKSIDSEYTANRRLDDGNLIDVPQPYLRGGTRAPKVGKKGKQTISRTDIRRLYQARWFIGTETVYDYGLMHNIPYNYAKRDVEFPIHMVRIKGKPIMETLKPIEDQIMMSWLRMQNDIATANPQGLAIEFGALENISFGNKKLQPKDVLKIYSATARLMYKLQPSSMPGQQGKVVNQRPITPIPGGLGPALADAITSISFQYQQLDIISGIDAMTSANVRPTERQGKAVTEIALASTGNTLKPIYSSYLRLKEARARCAAYTIQAIVYGYDDLQDCPYYKVIGSGALAAIQAAGPLPAVDYGFRMEARPTEQERNEALAAAKAGLAGGKNGIPALTYSEYLFVLRHITNGVGKSIKFVEIYMAKKEAEKQQLAHQRSLETQKLQIDGAVQQKEVEKQANADKIKGEKDLQLEVTKEKGTQLRLTERLKHTNNMALEKLKLSVGQKPPPESEN